MLNFIRRIRERWIWYLYCRQLDRTYTVIKHYYLGKFGRRDTLEIDRELNKLNAMRHKMERGE